MQLTSWIAVAVIVLTVAALVKKWDVRTTLLCSGLFLCCTALKPLDGLNQFAKMMTNGTLVQAICGAMGFAFVITLTKCDLHFSKADCTRIVVAQKSVKRLWAKLHKIFNTARGTSLGWTIKAITPILRGWRNYYRLDDRKQYWEEMDQRIRHHLRKLIWIAWKKSKTRERNLVKLGIDPERAWKSSGNGRGAWWNSGQSHMNQAIKNDRFVRLGLYSLRFMEIR